MLQPIRAQIPAGSRLFESLLPVEGCSLSATVDLPGRCRCDYPGLVIATPPELEILQHGLGCIVHP